MGVAEVRVAVVSDGTVPTEDRHSQSHGCNNYNYYNYWFTVDAFHTSIT